jgi:uncharacterized membrane protein
MNALDRQAARRTSPRREETLAPDPHNPSHATLHLIGLCGWALFTVWAATLLTWAVIQPEPYAQGWRLVAELALLGHVLNVADGTSSGFSREYLLIQSGLQDIILVLVAYPWVVRAYQGMKTRGLIGKTIDNFRLNAENKHKYVAPFGAIGLWVFVFFPFWGTGALVGSIIGYLIGLRTWMIFASVLSGHFLGVVTTVLFFNFVRQWTEGFNHAAVAYLPWIIAAGIALAWAGNQVYKRLRKAPATK